MDTNVASSVNTTAALLRKSPASNGIGLQNTDPSIQDKKDAAAKAAAALPVSPTTSTSTTAAQPAAPELPTFAALDPNALGERTLEGLMEAWGTSDAMYDLDKSGVVDMSDLVSLLASRNDAAAIPGGPTEDPGATAGSKDVTVKTPDDIGTTPVAGDAKTTGDANDAANGAAEIKADLTVDDVLQAWGQSGATDLDASGTTDMQDLISLLAMQSAGASGDLANPGVKADINADPASISTIATAASAKTDIASSVGTTAETGEAASPAVITADAIVKAFGTTGESELDIDGSGRVNIHDLTAFINKLADSGGTDPAATTVGDLSSLAAGLYSNFANAGFGETPPVNLHGILDSLKLPDGFTKQLTGHLADLYPNGLGLDTKA